MKRNMTRLQLNIVENVTPIQWFPDMSVEKYEDISGIVQWCIF